MEWTVRTVLVALVGLLATVGAPVIKLNSNLTKLTVLLDTLKNDMQEQKKCNRSIIPRTGKEKSLENGARKV